MYMITLACIKIVSYMICTEKKVVYLYVNIKYNNSYFEEDHASSLNDQLLLKFFIIKYKYIKYRTVCKR